MESYFHIKFLPSSLAAALPQDTVVRYSIQ